MRQVVLRFVSHREHECWLRNDVFLNLPSTQISIWLVDTPSIISESTKFGVDAESPLWTREQQNVCLDVCLGTSFASNSPISHEQGERSFSLPSTTTKVAAVIFNLFALEGLVIADIAHIPCVALHPYPPPSRNNSSRCSYPDGGKGGLKKRLAEDWPYLLGQLELASALNEVDVELSRCSGTCPSLNFEEFEHWVKLPA